MQHMVIVRYEGKDRWTAHSASVPSVGAVAPSHDEAVERVRRSLTEFFATAELVPVDVPTAVVNPWLDHFGSSADDPDFSEHLAAVKKLRDGLDKE